MVLLLPIALYFSVEGFFEGFNNISFVAFMLAIGYRVPQRVPENVARGRQCLNAYNWRLRPHVRAGDLNYVTRSKLNRPDSFHRGKIA
jgi:hypothetical protein